MTSDEFKKERPAHVRLGIVALIANDPGDQKCNGDENERMPREKRFPVAPLHNATRIRPGKKPRLQPIKCSREVEK